MRRLVPVAVIMSLLFVAGCGGGQEDAPSGAAGTGSPAAQSADERTSPAPPKTADAGTLLKQLKAANLGVTNIAVQDEDTDPNNLLGRPNGYLSRASADLPGGDKGSDKYGIDRGLVVEVFADADAAASRSKYIQDLQKGSPLLGSEWHYTAAGGRALIRVSGNVKPSLAKKIEAAAAKM